MPDEAIIAGFKGSVDFYYWKGIPCFRSWPRTPGHERAPAVMAQWPSFTYAAREWSQLSPAVQEAFRWMATNSGLSARDMQMRAYLSGLYRYTTP